MPPLTAQETDALLTDKQAFANRLAETFEPRDVIELMLVLGLRFSDLALALNVHPRTVRAWVESDDRDPSRQRDGILKLKALILFLLRRGILSPRQIALWLVEPHEKLGFRRPLAVMAEENGLGEVVTVSAPFTRPEPELNRHLPAKQSVAAGAVGRDAGQAT